MDKWEKLGLVFDLKTYKNRPEWMHDYAAVPFIEEIKEGVFRVYFSCRNKDNKSLTGWVEIDANDFFSEAINISEKPLLQLGRKGMFDEDGVMGCHITNFKGNKYFYYIGWNLGSSTPFRNAIGLAKLTDDNVFKKISEGPIIDRSIHDKCFVASNCVFDDNGLLRMYYLSCDEWIDKKGVLTHKYNIKYAESKDGINWKRDGVIAIDFEYDNEYAISVPRVIKDGDEDYKMWYSYRGGLESEFYRIGYAESKDGISWERKDKEIQFEGSQNSWDSKMMCYPFVFDYQGDRYMLYNGNDYGRTGFGLAVLKK